MIATTNTRDDAVCENAALYVDNNDNGVSCGKSTSQE